MSTRKELAQLISTLCSTFNVDISDDLVAAYAESLADIDFVFVKAACDQLVKESDWMPKPAEIRRVSKREQAEANPIPAEPEHWRRDTHSCRTCHDTGYVTVWHPTAMQSAIWHVNGKIPRERLRLPTCDARCTCSIGMAKPAGVRHRKRPDGSEPQEPVRFKSPPMIHVDPKLSPTDQIETLLAWARDWKPTPQAGDRVNEFDQWNREEF